MNQTDPSALTAMVDTDVQNILGLVYKQKLPLTNYFLFTDYDKIIVRYLCQEVENYWYKDTNEEYYVMVRNRTFDYWMPMAMAISSLDRITDINGLRPQIYEPGFCPN